MTSAWWFDKTRHIVPNHLVSTPHPAVSVVKRCIPFKVEFVVRAYLTGSTGTSIWMHYNAGSRSYCGHTLPEGEQSPNVCVCVCVCVCVWEAEHL
jgi:phosphoribosylaminoimidazole-succinocarboxamide synthase